MGNTHQSYEERKPGLELLTPVVTFKFPAITQEDRKYGGYKVTVILPPDLAEKVAAALYDMAVDAYGGNRAEKCTMPYSLNENGEMELRFRSKYQPAVYDLTANLVEDIPNIGNGTKGKVKGWIRPSLKPGDTGLVAALQAVQIADLKTYGGASFNALDDSDIDLSELENPFTVGEGPFLRSHVPAEAAQDEVKAKGETSANRRPPPKQKLNLDI